jgi:hypothetical protein
VGTTLSKQMEPNSLHTLGKCDSRLDHANCTMDTVISALQALLNCGTLIQRGHMQSLKSSVAATSGRPSFPCGAWHPAKAAEPEESSIQLEVAMEMVTWHLSLCQRETGEQWREENRLWKSCSR